MRTERVEQEALRRAISLTWDVFGQAHSLRRPLACHPRSGAKRSGAGSEATLTRQRPDTLSRESAPLRALGGLCGLCRAPSFWHLRISFCVWIRSVSPSLPCSPDDRITSHPVELVGSDHNPSCSRASGSGWRDHPVKRRVSAKGKRGHRPPGSGEAVAFSFAGMGSSH